MRNTLREEWRSAKEEIGVVLYNKGGIGEGGAAVSHTWELREGKVLVVEDAKTASLVVVARDLKDRNDKAAVLKEILRKLQA